MSKRRKVNGLLRFLLARAGPPDPSLKWVRLALIVLWHATVLPVTFVAVNHLYEDPARTFSLVAEPFFWAVMMIGFGVELLLAWSIFRLRTMRRSMAFTSFDGYWWQTCVLGAAMWPAASLTFGFAIMGDPSFSYDVAINFPLLWFVLAAPVPALLYRKPPLTHCQNCGIDVCGSTAPCSHCGAIRRCHGCGYDLNANATGRCPECGAAIPGWPPCS